MRRSKGFSEIILIILCAVVIIAGVAYFLLRERTSLPNLLQNGIDRITNVDSGKIAIRIGGGVLETGDLWVSDNEGKEKTKITTSGNVERVFGWSPDNKNVLISNKYSKDFAAIDVENNSVTPLPIKLSDTGDGTSGFFWTGNDEISYIDNHIFYKVTLDGKTQKVVTLPSKSIYYHLSPDATYVLYDSAFPDSPSANVNVSVYSIKDKIEVKITTEGGAEAIGWMGDRVLYQQDGKLKSAFSDGTNKKELADLGDWYILGAVSSKDGKKLFYTADNRLGKSANLGALFVYDDTTGKIKELNKLDQDMYAQDLTISRDSKYGAFTLAGVKNAPSIVINLDTGSTKGICDNSCYYPVWQK